MNDIDGKLRDHCRRDRLDGIIIRRRSNAAWATGGADFHVDTAGNLGIATLIWTPGRKLVLTDNIELPRLRDEEPLEGWDIEAVDWWEADRRVEKLLRSGGYATDWPDDPFYELRAELTPAEIDRARDLGRDTAEVVCRILREDVRPGMTERHLGGALAGWLRDRGIFTHVVLVAADDRIRRYRHPIPTARPIERLAMAAVCAQRSGLIVSVTRLVHFGPINAELRRRHEAVCAVDRALHGATRPGIRWCDALQAGIDAYAAASFPDEWRKHHQGGPMGYEARDFRATPTETRLVLPNQLVGWNPTITGTKSEDTILSSGEIITRAEDWPVQDGRPSILERDRSSP